MNKKTLKRANELMRERGELLRKKRALSDIADVLKRGNARFVEIIVNLDGEDEHVTCIYKKDLDCLRRTFKKMSDCMNANIKRIDNEFKGL